MLKKVGVFLLLFTLFTSNTFSDLNFEYTPENASKQELLRERGGNNLVATIDRALEKYSDNKLVRIQNRIQKFKINKNISRLSLKNQRILLYLSDAIRSEQEKRRKNVNLEDILQENNLTESEKSEVSKSILSLQNHLLSEIESIEDTLLSQWKDSLYMQSKGDMDIEVDIDFGEKFDMEMGLKLRDYIAKQHLYNQSLEAQIDGYLKKKNGDTTENYSLSSYMDFIAHEGNAYMIFKNMDISANNEELDRIFEIVSTKLNNLASQNTYISQEQEGAAYLQNVMAMLKKINIDQYKHIIETTPLLEAYKKTDTGITLIPTQSLCNLGKKASGIFDPLSSEKCTKSQYEKFLKEYLGSALHFQLELGNSQTLRLAGSEKNTQLDMNLTWDRYNLQDMHLYVSNPLNPQENYAKFDWDFGNSAQIKYIFEGDTSGEGNIIFRNNSLSSITFHATSPKTQFDLVYKQENLDIELTSKSVNGSLECHLGGELAQDSVDLSGECNINSSFIGYFIPNTQELNAQMNIIGDMRSSKNNMNMDFSLSSPSKNIMSFKLSNTGTKTKLSEEDIISAPKKSQSIETFSQELGQELSPVIDPLD